MFKQVLTPYSLYGLLLVVFIAVFNFIYNVSLPIHPDEAYYWYWSKRLELGYFDHPPMVAYLIKSATLFSDNVFFVRLPAILSVVISSFFLYLLTKKIKDEKAAFLALVIYLSLPVIQVSATITTPDSALLIFWCGALYFGYLALSGTRIRDIYLTGIFLGLALLSKLPAILLIGMLGLLILLKRRDLLASIHTWIAFGLIFVIFGGMLHWNGQHEWVSFTFQYAHGSSKSFAISPEYLGEYVGGFVLLMTPLFFLLTLYLLVKSPLKSLGEGEKYLLFITAFILLFFAYKALYKPMALNWYAPALMTLIPFLAIRIRMMGLKKSLIASVAVALVFTAVAKFPALFLPKKLNPEYRLFGYEEAVGAFREYIRDKKGPLCADYYSTASVLHYYLGETDRHISSSLSPRPNMYTLWDDEEGIKAQSCLAFVEHSKLQSHIKEKCPRISDVHYETIPGDTTRDKHFIFFRCEPERPLGDSVLKLQEK